MLTAGTRVKLSGGYDMEPRWLGGKAAHLATLEGFIPGQGASSAAVVRLDEPITVDGLTGSYLVLELRYVGATWASGAVVHVELCNFVPEPRRWQERRQGRW